MDTADSYVKFYEILVLAALSSRTRICLEAPPIIKSRDT